MRVRCDIINETEYKESYHMLKNAIVGQSGGPSAAINATLAGVIQGVKNGGFANKLYGAKHGIQGILEEDFVDLSAVDEDTLKRIKCSPAMALGSCRVKLPAIEDDLAPYKKIEEIFDKYDIGYFFYIGGNDSMDTVLMLDKYFKSINKPVVCIGLPKTIDNDLCITDHTPGFGSAAKYLAYTMNEIIADTQIYKIKCVTIVEVMGRNSGWLTLAAALPRVLGGNKPDLVYLPETPFDENEFLSKINPLFEKTDNVIVAVSEGIKFADGSYVSAQKCGSADLFGHAALSGAGKYLEMLVRDKIGCKVRSIELNILQRCAYHIASESDIEESFAVGLSAADTAKKGITGVMNCIIRTGNNPYAVKFEPHPIQGIADAEKYVPLPWCDLENEQSKKEIADYILPLIQGDVEVFTDKNGLPEYFTFL